MKPFKVYFKDSISENSQTVVVELNQTCIDAAKQFIANTRFNLEDITNIVELEITTGRPFSKGIILKTSSELLDCIDTVLRETSMYFSGNGSNIILDLAEMETLLAEDEDSLDSQYQKIIDNCLTEGLDLAAISAGGVSYLELWC